MERRSGPSRRSSPAGGTGRRRLSDERQRARTDGGAPLKLVPQAAEPKERQVAATASRAQSAMLGTAKLTNQRLV